MTEIIVKYNDVPPSGHPNVTLHLFHKGKLKHSVVCLVDSGADCTTLPSSMSTLIYGFNICAMAVAFLKRIGAQMNESECFCGDRIKSVKLPLLISFDNYTFPININWVDNPNAMPLLGREDFFECFRVQFDELNKQVLFCPNQERIEQNKQKYDFERINDLIMKLKTD
ncbi:MAG TPA: hypothetical protein VJH88_03845 [Candidatus Nanoarchaeia archaeon]|nr:hypothetical protein [Candidatus Nanoarchaeia archaeon]